MLYSDTALGLAIKELRTAASPKVSQVQLGEAAGYGAGAGVSVSRVESGKMRPSDDKIELIVKQLGCTRRQLDDLAYAKDLALNDTRRSPAADVPVKSRLLKVQQAVEVRTNLITQRAEAFNVAHDRARDEFFLPFVQAAQRIDGAPPPPQLPVADEDAFTDSATAARHRLEVNSNAVALGLAGAGGLGAGAAAGGAAAYATFTAAAMLGSESTGAAISGLSGVAATNATLALLGGGTVAAGGAGVAGGTMLLAGIVAGPAVLLAAGGVAWMVRRNRAKEAELRKQLDEAEAQLAATQHGFDALVLALTRATDVLTYVSVHAAHSQHRWGISLPEPDSETGTVSWDALDTQQRATYQNLIAAAGSQLGAANINAEAYMVATGVELETLIELTDQTLEQADHALRLAV